MPAQKSPSLSEQVRNLRARLKESNRKAKELESLYERLCHAVGYDKLANSWDKDFKNGWVNSWLFPLYEFFESHKGETINANLRNQALDIVQAIIAQLVILGKYGIQLPHDVRPFDWQANESKKQSQFLKNYPPCVICGETRITEVCHIIPRAHGGVNHADNYLMMCPLHHHLFDHARFTKSEWDKLMLALDGKMEAAIIYTKTVRLRSMQFFWNEVEGVSSFSKSQES